MTIIRTQVMIGVLIGSVAIADPIDRTTMWTDAVVDAQARRWGEDGVRKDGAVAQHKELEKWRQDILNSDKLPENARIDLLSKALDKISRFNIYQVGERIEIYDMARNMMASIPGHAKYFTDKVEQQWGSSFESVRKAESALPSGWENQPLESEISKSIARAMFELNPWGKYSEICSENIGMLGHIPSTESVRTLGNYLRDRDEPGIRFRSRGTGFTAAKSLTELISDGPMQTWSASYEDVPKWQKWFDEVKAGKRTFKFVGSSVEFTLNGPATKEQLEKIAKDRKRAETLTNQAMILGLLAMVASIVAFRYAGRSAKSKGDDMS